MTADEIASLAPRTGGYPCIPIEQVSAQDHFRQTGDWPAHPTEEQVFHLCDWQRTRRFATVPCGDLVTP